MVLLVESIFSYGTYQPCLGATNADRPDPRRPHVRHEAPPRNPGPGEVEFFRVFSCLECCQIMMS